jgi:hypothetical protein
MRVLSCPKCSFETSEVLAKCPSCGSRLQSAKKVRILGGLLLVIGTFLVLFMSILGIYLGSIISNSSDPTATSRFSGGPQDVMFIAAIFGLVISFGLASIVGGIWQIVYGKPNRKIIVAVFVIAGILFVIARAVKTMS